jgi:DNA-binding transcriptional regulator/RsmH inhibitor MraZ
MTADEFKHLLEQNNAVLFGQMAKYFDQRTKELTDRLDAHDGRFDRVDRSLDGIAKQLETDEQERAAITNDLRRHKRWLDQLAEATDTKLATE